MQFLLSLLSAFDLGQHSVDERTIAERSRRTGCAFFYRSCILFSISYDSYESDPCRWEPFRPSASAWWDNFRDASWPRNSRTIDPMPNETHFSLLIFRFLSDIVMTWLKKHSRAQGHSKQAIVSASRADFGFGELAKIKRRWLRAAVWLGLS